jgi:nucleoside-diphosphate-sugar epimerase
VPVREVVERLGALTGRGDLIDFGARPTPANEPSRLVADIGRLTGTVGFKPRFEVADGLAHTVAWWQSQAGRERA